MRFFINSSLIQQLVDPSEDLRRKALNEVSATLKNNILFGAKTNENSVAKDELNVVNLCQLVRNLIKWFQYKPVTNENEIFDLLILIFSRKDFLEHIAKSISIERLKKEILKIRKRLIPNESERRLRAIERILNEYNEDEDSVISLDSSEVETLDTTQDKSMNSTLISQMNKLKISSKTIKDDNEVVEIEKDYWMVPEGIELDELNNIATALTLYNEEYFDGVLKLLQVTVDDFPPEYFLHSPNVLEKLLEIFPEVTHQQSLKIISIVRSIFKNLKARYTEFALQNLNYIPLKSHCNKICQFISCYLEKFSENFTVTRLHKNQEKIHEIYLLLFDIVDFIKDSQDVCEIYLNELLNMFAKVVKQYRVAYATVENGVILKLNYLVGIYIINAFISNIDVGRITQFCENNLWEYECDTALLDWPLKFSHEGIYNLLSANRADAISDDQEMKMLLSIEKIWKPVVAVFQNWKNMQDEEIIIKGATVLDTIYIHKSLEFVDLMLNSIQNCSKSFSSKTQLKTTAEEIFLRLLSIEALEVRNRTYAKARELVQKRLSDDQEEIFRDADLCVVLGIPLTTEIVTEMLCFGYADTEEIHKNVKLILFALLRAKIVFPNHWFKILEIIKPILPMLPCFFDTDQKLGFFAFDIFNEHAGFEKVELDQAYARFLYCKHPKAREMAKIKLLQNLNTGDYPNDLIDIIPDDFCILPSEHLCDLQMPESKLNFDKEAYETTIQVFKSMDRKDGELLQSTLLQLSVLMNSRKVCIKSHDDNIWVYFMTALDFGFPNNAIIRKLTVNILQKWVVCIPSFRIYLSNEPTVLQFLINTLVYFQDDVHTKRQATELLFLLLFSDFVVPSERTVSLPKFLRSLQTPFRFNVHWTESPFKKMSEIEWLYNAVVSETDNHNKNIQEKIKSYIRFTFANVWFKDNLSFDNVDYAVNNYVLNLPENLKLSERDLKNIRDTSIAKFMKAASRNLNNATTTEQIEELIPIIKCCLLLPGVTTDNVADFLELNRISNWNPIAIIDIYQHILSHLSDKQIAVILTKKCIYDALTTPDSEIYTQVLTLVNQIIKTCDSHQNLAGLIVKKFKENQKIDFPTHLIEKCFQHLYGNLIKSNKSWSDLELKAEIKIILSVIRNILHFIPCTLNESFVSEMFDKLLSSSRYLLKTKKKKSSVCMLNLIMGIVEKLSMLSYNFKMKEEHYSTIFLWLMESEMTNNALPWMVVGNLTNQKHKLDEFCKGFEAAQNFDFYSVLFKKILDSKILFDCEQASLAILIGNFLEHVADGEKKKFGIVEDRDLINLAKLFIARKDCENSVDYLIRILIHTNANEVVEIVRQRNLIEKFLLKDVKCLETVILCCNNDALNKLAVNTLINIKEEVVVKLISNIQDPFDANEAQSKVDRNNRSILTIIEIILNSNDGIEKVHFALTRLRLFTKLSLSIFDGILLQKSVNLITFNLKFMYSLLNAGGVNGNILQFFETNELTKLSITDVNFKPDQKSGTFLEEHFKDVEFAIDLLLLQTINTFNCVDSSAFTEEHKYDIKALCFLIIKKMMQCSNRAQYMAYNVNLMELLIRKSNEFVTNLQSVPFSDLTKKSGAQKSHLKIKEYCIYLKAPYEWNLQINENDCKIQDLVRKMMKTFVWIEHDCMLYNCFLNFIELLHKMDILKNIHIHDAHNTPLVKLIFTKCKSISQKSPHTEVNLQILKSALRTLKSFCSSVEVRLLMGNLKIFQILEALHPQLQANKRTSWNDVTLAWLNFFETLSKYEDMECNAGQISLLCRIIRLGSAEIRKSSLKVIRNFSLNSSIGHVVLSSVDFTDTVDIILSENASFAEKSLILETLLSIASKSEKIKSKLINSSLNRKLKQHLTNLQSKSSLITDPEAFNVFYLSETLHNFLFPKA